MRHIRNLIPNAVCHDQAGFIFELQKVVHDAGIPEEGFS
jgi:hypothetical protein